MTFGDDDDKKHDNTEKEDKVADVHVEKVENHYEAVVTRESGKTGSGFGKFTQERAVDNAVSDSE